MTLQDASGNNAFVLDMSTSHLKIYENISSPSRYADIYYDDVAGEAVFKASSGNTRIGGTSGNFVITLGNQADTFSYTKSATLGSAYSSDDMTVRRSIAAGSNSLTGSVLRVESTSSGTGTVASNILWLNENNTSATGNLILATTGGAGNNKFRVDLQGNVTIGASATYSGGTFSGTSFSGGAFSGTTVNGTTLTASTSVSSASFTNTGAVTVSSGGTNTDLTLQSAGTGSVVLKPGSNSATAIQLENATGGGMMTIDTTTSGTKLGSVVIGSATADANVVITQLDSYNAFGSEPTCGTTTSQGGLYYNTASNTIRGCVNGGWEDMPSTASLGIFLFGVVPDSGSNPGDLPALTTTGVTGPCKVSWASVTSVAIAPCTAYSGGRKVIIPATTLSVAGGTWASGVSTTNIWAHICLTGANNQPAFSAANSAETATANMPTFSINNPILCLADIKFSATTSGNIAQIYDVRTFINSQKEFTTMSTAGGLGMAVCPSTFHGIPCNAITLNVMGIVVASTGGTSTTSPAAIITTTGPAYVKASSGTAGQLITTSATAGYVTTTGTAATTTAGLVRTTGVATCTTAATCLGSLYVNVKGK
jgi:fibronectin-binding autotransporter adhesin